MSQIRKPLGDLPRSQKQEGFPPAKNNFVAEAIAQIWHEIETGVRDPHTVSVELGKHGESGGRRPHAIPDAGPYRASLSGSRCDRAAFYQMAGYDETNPMTIADSWRAALGTIVHDVIEDVAPIMFEENEDVTDVDNESTLDLRLIGINGSGSGDILITYKGVKTAVEVKTVGGFKFKLAATTFKGPPQGPSYGHILQGAMAAKVLGADQLIIAYLSMENVSPKLAEAYASSEAGRFAAEWHYNVEQLEPLIASEVERAGSMEQLIAANTDAPEGHAVALAERELRDPEYPIGAVVTNPKSGMWTVLADDGDSITDTGTTWMCDYCRYRDQCIGDG